MADEHSGNGRDFDWTDDDGDIVVEAQQPIAVYRNPKGDVVIRQAGWPDEDAWISFRIEHARAVADAILRAADLSDDEFEAEPSGPARSGELPLQGAAS